MNTPDALPGNDTRLLADIGGTNARFAWQAAPAADIDHQQTLACADHPSLAAAIAAYLGGQGLPTPAACAIAIATPITGDLVRMTNHHWAFSIDELKTRCGFERLRVLNDFSALALALPGLSPDDLRQVGGAAPVRDSAIALIGPGTGLGVSGLLPDGRGGWVALQGEGGHATLAPRSAREEQVLQHIERVYGHASGERVVSGQGLVDIHRALTTINGSETAADECTPAAIVARGTAGNDALCRETLDLFSAFLGTAAGNLALTLGARGGVYIGGGIVPRLGELFAQSAFRARFEAKGRFSHYLSQIPVQLIVARQSPALLGAARALDSHDGR